MAADKLNAEFGAGAVDANLLLTGADEPAVAAYTADVEAVDGIVAVQPVAAEGDNTLLRARLGRQQPDRGEPGHRHGAARRRAGRPARSLVGGTTADTVDLIASVGSHLPWMGLIVSA